MLEILGQVNTAGAVLTDRVPPSTRFTPLLSKACEREVAVIISCEVRFSSRSFYITFVAGSFGVLEIGRYILTRVRFRPRSFCGGAATTKAVVAANR